MKELRRNRLVLTSMFSQYSFPVLFGLALNVGTSQCRVHVFLTP